MGVPAGRSVLGRRSVAQGRVTVSVVVFVFEVADHDAGLEQGVPVVAVEAVWRCGARSHSRDFLRPDFGQISAHCPGRWFWRERRGGSRVRGRRR